MEEKVHIVFSVVVIDHIYFDLFFWRFVIGLNDEGRLIVGQMTCESHTQYQCREDRITQENFRSIEIEILTIMGFNLKFQNQVLIESDGCDYFLVLNFVQFVINHKVLLIIVITKWVIIKNNLIRLRNVEWSM